jgi:RNA polymerase sigma-70 factor (sigma-E family)
MPLADVLDDVMVSEETTYAELVAARAPALLRLAVMLTGSRVEAEDLLQVTLLRAQPHADRIESLAAPAAYLRRIMVREHLSSLRTLRRRVRTSPLGDDDIPAPDDVAGTVQRRETTWLLLATLPRRQRAVLVLRFYEDLPDAAIAAALGCTESTVRSNAARGLAALRARLAETEEFQP